MVSLTYDYCRCRGGRTVFYRYNIKRLYIIIQTSVLYYYYIVTSCHRARVCGSPATFRADILTVLYTAAVEILWYTRYPRYIIGIVGERRRAGRNSERVWHRKFASSSIIGRLNFSATGYTIMGRVGERDTTHVGSGGRGVRWSPTGFSSSLIPVPQ